MDWKALLADFTAKLAEATNDKPADEAAKILAAASDALPQSARQHLHDLGLAKGEEKAGDTTAIETERDEAKKAAETAQAKVTALETQLAEKQPEVARVKADYEKALADKDAELVAAKADGAKALNDQRVAGAQSQLVAGLSGRLLTESLARGVASDPQVASRLVVGEDGTMTAYQADGKTPIALSGGQTAVEALVADVVASQPKELLKAAGSGGSGAGSGDPGAPDDFATIRSEVKAQYGGDADDKRKRLDKI